MSNSVNKQLQFVSSLFKVSVLKANASAESREPVDILLHISLTAMTLAGAVCLTVPKHAMQMMLPCV